MRSRPGQDQGTGYLGKGETIVTKLSMILETILWASQHRPEPKEGETSVKKLRIEFDADLINEQELREAIERAL